MMPVVRGVCAECDAVTSLEGRRCGGDSSSPSASAPLAPVSPGGREAFPCALTSIDRRTPPWR